MAILSNINGKFAVDSTGAIQLSGSAGTANYVLVSGGAGVAASWYDIQGDLDDYLLLTGGTLTGNLSLTDASNPSLTVSTGATVLGGTLNVTGLLTGTTATFSGDVNITQTADVGVLNVANLDSGAAVGLSLTYPTTNVAAGDGLAIAIGIAGRGRSYIANSNVTTNLDASNLVFYTEDGGVIGERMRIDSAGRLSLGPDAQDIQIDPASTNSGNNLIYMRGNASDDKSSLQMNHYGHADYYIGVGHVADGKFNIANDLTGNDFVIDTSGNVGIGTDSPSVLLQVGDAPTGVDIQGAHIYGYDGALNLYTTRSENPFNAALYLYNNPAVGAGDGTGILFRARTGGGGGGEYTAGRMQGAIYTSWTINTDATRTAKMVFRTTDSTVTSDKVTILGNGYVGIGATAPATLLSNTATRIGNADGLTVNLSGTNWEVNGQGYVGAFSNLATGAAQHNAGVLIEIAGDDATDKILDLESGGSNKLRVYGTGNINFNGNEFDFSGSTVAGTELNLYGGHDASAPGGRITSVTTGIGANSTEINMNQGGIDFDPGTGSSAMVIDSNGEVGINNTSPSATLHLTALSSTGVPFKLQGHASTSVEQMLIYTAQTAGTGWYFLVGQATILGVPNVSQLIIYGNGDVQNTNNSYAALSDERLKENIIDTAPKLEDIKKLRVINYNLIGDDKKLLGMVAQEVEEVFPGLVENNLQPSVNGKPRERIKSLKYSVLVPMLVKSIQELEARVKELENK